MKSLLKKTQVYIGIPYKFGGKNIKGLDCYGLIELFFKNELGVSISIEYNPNNISLKKTKKFRSVPLYYGFKNLDILCFKLPNGPLHAGIFIDNYLFHSDLKTGVVLEEIRAYPFFKFLKIVYRLNEYSS